MDAAQRVAHRADEAHQRRPWLAFPFAVIKKFGDDQAANLAALVAYYGLSPPLSFAALLSTCLASQPTVMDPIIQGWIAQR
jgi:membrane protein